MVNQDEQHRKKSCRKKGKLKDQEYVKRYERGKFLVINKGEQIDKLSDDSSNNKKNIKLCLILSEEQAEFLYAI